MLMIAVALVVGAAGCAGPDDPETTASQAANGGEVENRGADKDNWWDSLPRPEWAAFEKVATDQDWFEVYRLMDGIYAIYEPGQFEEVISFLVEGSDTALLFDTGLGIGDIRQVVDDLTDRDIIVLNSHTHYDHIGGNHQFETIYGMDTAFTRSRAKGSAHEAVAEFLSDGWVWKELPEGFVPAQYRSHPFLISKVVTEGDIIDIGGRKLEILVTPGHAPDSICLIDRENRLLFTGDTFYLAPLYTHLEGSDFDDYSETAARLASLAPAIDSALTSHNVPVVAANYMTALGQAFADIRSGRATDYTDDAGTREYHFDGFSIIVKEKQ